MPIIVSIPNSFLTTDVGGNGLASPNGDAQATSAIIREAYLSLIEEWPDVVVHDTQEEVFGKTSLATSPYMGDQIHQNTAGIDAKVAALIKLIGHTAPPTPARIVAARAASRIRRGPSTAASLRTPPVIVLASGRYQAQPSTSIDFEYLAGQRNNMVRYDIVELPD